MGVKYRQTVEVVKAGQRESYQDTEMIVQVTFERTDSNNIFAPDYISKDIALIRLHKVAFFTDHKKDGDKEPFRTYLDYVRPIDKITADQLVEQGDPNVVLHSIWEFRVVTPFTD